MSVDSIASPRPVNNKSLELAGPVRGLLPRTAWRAPAWRAGAALGRLARPESETRGTPCPLARPRAALQKPPATPQPTGCRRVASCCGAARLEGRAVPRSNCEARTRRLQDPPVEATWYTWLSHEHASERFHQRAARARFPAPVPPVRAAVPKPADGRGAL